MKYNQHFENVVNVTANKQGSEITEYDVKESEEYEGGDGNEYDVS